MFCVGEVEVFQICIYRKRRKCILIEEEGIDWFVGVIFWMNKTKRKCLEDEECTWWICFCFLFFSRTVCVKYSSLRITFALMSFLNWFFYPLIRYLLSFSKASFSFSHLSFICMIHIYSSFQRKRSMFI